MNIEFEGRKIANRWPDQKLVQHFDVPILCCNHYARYFLEGLGYGA